ncbi:MAG: RNA polymerase factor sigma-54 [Chitinophagales bacterium]
MLKQKLNQSLQQKLSPQQIQLMKLLQVPTASLEQRIKEELEINPALEENDFEEEDDMDKLMGGESAKDEKKEEEEDYDPMEDVDLSDYLTDDDVASYKLRDESYGSDLDEENKSIPIPVISTFHEHLTKQLGMVTLDERGFTIANQIIGSIDDDGYLRRELEAIVDDLSFSQNIEAQEDEVEKIIKVIQNFEPAGVCARDLQECLLIQIRRKSKQNDNKYLEIAEDVLENHFEEFAKKHYPKLIKSLSITNNDLKEAVEEILKLNPKPGGTYSNSAKPENYIIPDFIINNDNGDLLLRLNSRNAPDLRISDSYKDMLKSYSKTKKKSKKQKDAVLFIKQKIDAAKWFIDAIRQRQQTMLKTMQTILDYQYEYFLTGDETKLRPMILKDIAEITALDISTISRVSNSKYVQTEFGTFKLKSFFSESLQTDSGEEVSTREVKKILQDFIDNENKRKPLSDQKLTEELVLLGYNIARRTVAKYREQLNIPVARLRRQL